jgi:putative ABC transport system substrate-binding protein
MSKSISEYLPPLAQEGAQGLLVAEESENVTHTRLIPELAAKRRLPAIYSFREFVEVGGLMAYGIDVSDVGHRMADLADKKYLKGPNRPTSPSSNRPSSS